MYGTESVEQAGSGGVIIVEKQIKSGYSVRQVLCSACLALLSASAFFMNLYDTTPDVSAYTGLSQDLFRIYYRVLNAVNGVGMELSLACAAFFALYLYIARQEKYHGRIRLGWLLSAFFGGVYVAGLIFLEDVQATTSAVQVLKLAVVFAGTTVFYRALLSILRYALTREIHLREGGRLSALWTRFLKHPFRNTFLILLICWIIPLLLKYPAGLCYDVRFQIDQGLGNVELTSHHPILHTLMLSWFVRFGIAIGSPNIGIFLFAAVETVVFALAAAYGMKALCRLKAAEWTRMVYLLFFAFSPFVTGYVGTAIKDTYFSIFSLLFTIVFAESVLEEDFWDGWKRPVLFLAAAAGLVLFRNNGLYVLIGTAVISLLLDHKTKKGRRFRRCAILLLAILIPVGISNGLEAAYDVEDGSVVEALSLPLQQIARTVRDHSDSITEEEAAVIDKVVDYESLAEAYDPYLADAVKRLWQYPTNEELMDFFRVWLKLFFREPLCYLSATLEQNVMLGYPGYTNFTYYIGSYDDGYPNTYGILFTTPDWLASLQNVYSGVISLLHRAPILYWINNMSTSTILLFALLVLFINRGDWRNLLYLVPAFIAVLVVLLAPGIILNVRYMLPVIYTVPFYIGCYTAPGSRTGSRNRPAAAPSDAAEPVPQEDNSVRTKGG